jgi:hypothetical protein
MKLIDYLFKVKIIEYPKERGSSDFTVVRRGKILTDCNCTLFEGVWTISNSSVFYKYKASRVNHKINNMHRLTAKRCYSYYQTDESYV